MQSQVSEIDPVTVEVQVEVPWDRVQKGLDERFGTLQKQARIKGFRPGKAPRNVVVKLFSKEVRAEVAGNLVEQGVREAVTEHQLPIVSAGQLEGDPQITEGQPLTFKVKLEVRPKIEELHSKLALTRTPAAVSDAELDAEIERLRGMQAIVRPVDPPRPAKKGDVLTVDWTITVDGVKNPEASGTDRQVELGDERLIPELSAALEGASPGETRTATLMRGEDDPNKELAGKAVVFDVVVKDVRERVLPELDDEFAKDVGEHESLADLKKATRERLEKAAKDRADRALRELAIDELVKANPIPVPPSLVNQQLRAMLEEMFRIMQMMGQQPRFPEGDMPEMKERAESKVRAVLLLGELSRKAEITVTAEEIDAKLREIAERSGKHIAKVKADYQGERREALESQLLEEKLVAHLLAEATITDAPATSGVGGAEAT